MSEQKQKTINIYHILNIFNKKFGMEPEIIKMGFVSEHHIYLKMVYGDYDESKPLWGDSITHKGKNFGMVKIWVTRNEKTKKPEFILWKDKGIYVNSFTMPDYEMAKQFQKSAYEMADNKVDFWINKYDIEISNKLLNQAIDSVYRSIETRVKFMSDNIKHKKIKENADEYIKETKEWADDISMNIETLQILQEELENRKNGNKEDCA